MITLFDDQGNTTDAHTLGKSQGANIEHGRLLQSRYKTSSSKLARSVRTFCNPKICLYFNRVPQLESYSSSAVRNTHSSSAARNHRIIKRVSRKHINPQAQRVPLVDDIDCAPLS